MHNKLIAEVPARIWEEGRPTGLHIWDAEFNVAAWVRVSATDGQIHLLLCHEDEAGQHGCIVDSCTISGESNNLVSGLIGVRFTGKVKKALVDVTGEAVEDKEAKMKMYLARQ